jgi:ribonuclease-3
LYNGFLRFSPLRKYIKFKSNRKGNFPRVGFLTDERVSELEKTLGVRIINREFFEQALIHRSYLQVLDSSNQINNQNHNESNKDTRFTSNERLEFLGDSILGMIAADYLFSLHTDFPEGELTKMRSWIVNKNSLSIAARKIELDEFLMLSHSASKSLEQGSDSILADALEAVIAAIYLDSGIENAKKFILNSLLPIMMNKSIMVDTNYKSILLEKAQAEGKEIPRYEVVDEEGPDHDKEFTISVYVGNELLGTGKGKTKKQAEQMAAYEAIQCE